jgi:hypothetical protein
VIRRANILAVAALMLIGLVGVANGQVDEVELKAAFVFNVAAFVVWPERTADDATPLQVCVHPASSMRQALAGLDGRSISGRRISVRVPASSDELNGCRIVVANFPQRRETPGDQHDGAGVDVRWPDRWWCRIGVLSIADGGSVDSNATVITLVRESTRLRFDVDTEAANTAHLELSSRLLSLARRVK